MLQCVYHKVYDYICQKIIDKNSRIFPNGIVEINPQLINDCLIHANQLEYRINKLNELAERIRIKERLVNTAISKCNDIIEEVFPMLDLTIKFIEQSINHNQLLENKREILLNNAHNLKSRRFLPENTPTALILKDGEKTNDVNKLLIDTFYNFKKKRDDMATWLTQIKNNPSLQIEA